MTTDPAPPPPPPAKTQRSAGCLRRLVSGFFVTTRLDCIGIAVEFYRTENNDEWTRHYAGGDVTYSASITIIRWVFGYEFSR